MLSADLGQAWAAPSTTDRDRKNLLRTLLEEVIIAIDREHYRADLTLHWQGGRIITLAVDLPHSRPATARTEEDTIDLVRRLARHYPDPLIAGILNRQGRLTARGLRFTTTAVAGLRRSWLNDGFIAGEQLTPGAPWQIRLTDDLRRQFVDQIPEGYLSMLQAIDRLGVSRQTMLQRVKRGALHAVHVRRGRQKDLCI